jgi:hypothetical protein
MDPLLPLGPLAADIEHVDPGNPRQYSNPHIHDGAEGRGEGKTHDSWPILNRVSVMPMLFARARKISFCVGM